MLEKYTGSIFFTNSYVISNGDEAIVVDPGLNFKENAQKINSRYHVKAVLLTHGHLDHIDGARYFNCPIYIGLSDAEFFHNSEESLYSLMHMESPYKNLELDIRTVKDKDILEIIGFKIKVIYTPGHTNGSVCYLFDNKELFSGDSLFVYGIPRTDFPTGDSKKLKKSFEKFFNLDDNIVVYPGHDESGSIALCKKNVMYF